MRDVKPWLVRFRVPGKAWIAFKRCSTEYEAFKAAEKLAWRLRGHYDFEWGIA